MGKWAFRLTEELAVPSTSGTARTAGSPLLSVVAVPREGVELESHTKEAASELRLARVDRLLRWGWPAVEAETVASRLALRDEQADRRVVCVECANYGRGRCKAHKAAGLWTPEVGQDLASMLQNCDAFTGMEGL